ncbi:GSCOCG00001443001-RA-CDS, partial [Cotesia congregata]
MRRTICYLVYFNRFHAKIQFTLECEKEGKIPFLDMVIMRTKDGNLLTNWYQKPTSSGRLLNFHLHHPTSQKQSVALGLLYRAMKLSHRSFHEENLIKVEKILKLNNFPKFFIKKCINKFKIMHANDIIMEDNCGMGGNRRSNNNYGGDSRFRFPYIKGLLESITRCFLGGTEWEPAFYNMKTEGQVFSRLKDKDDEMKVSNVVYKIPCDCGQSYIGQTSQYLGNRIYQHRYSCINSDKMKDKTALCVHYMDTGHKFDFDNIRILDRERVKFKRCLSEIIF